MSRQRSFSFDDIQKELNLLSEVPESIKILAQENPELAAYFAMMKDMQSQLQEAFTNLDQQLTELSAAADEDNVKIQTLTQENGRTHRGWIQQINKTIRVERNNYVLRRELARQTQYIERLHSQIRFLETQLWQASGALMCAAQVQQITSHQTYQVNESLFDTWKKKPNEPLWSNDWLLMPERSQLRVSAAMFPDNGDQDTTNTIEVEKLLKDCNFTN